ncbi:secreted PhoX family phosphatase [Vogesella perlucida]|nr:secreted PhoX family phosphatase [Vogesella perlucida]
MGNIKGDAFGSPDGLKFDHLGVLWVQTDVSTSTVNAKEYKDMGNNQMVAVVPETGEFRRFLTGPHGCEITGLAFTPDNKTMFVNIQHPGEPANERNDPAKPTAISTWPDGPKAGRPRAGTVVVRKLDGGVIGS